MADTDPAMLLNAKPEIIAEWRRLGSAGYVWERAAIFKGYRRWAVVTMAIAIVAVVANRHFEWWPPPHVEDPDKKILALLLTVAFVVGMTILDARMKITEDKRRLLESAGFKDVDPREVGLVGEDKPYLLIG